MVVVQAYLIPVYRRLSFTPSFWAFAFSYAAVAIYALHWLFLVHTPWVAPLSDFVITAITLLIGAISLRTLVALKQGTLLTISPMSRRAGDERDDGANPPTK
jgi:tellurite resistance protein